MRHLAEAGADGIHFDKVFAHPPLNFNPGPGLSPDQSWYTGVLRCMEETLATCQEVQPDFGLSVESSWDRLLTYSDAWWQWHDGLEGAVSPPHPRLQYSTPRHPRTGKRACALVTQAMEPLETCVAFEGRGPGDLRIYRPFEPVACGSSPLSLSISGERLVV